MNKPAFALSPRSANRVRIAAILGVLGPGLVSGFADNDAGGITTYSVAGAQFGYDLLWVLLVSQIVLFFTQEVGARLGLATGQGLAGLVRERYGVKWAAFMITAMLVANVGSIVAEFAGCGAAVTLMGLPSWLGALLAAVVVVVLLTRGSFKWVQYIFVAIGAAVSIAYFVSALLAHPDWGLAANSLFVPHLASSGVYWVAVVATVGTTITPWGQAFIQSYVADKRLGPEDLAGERLDVGFGALLTNLIAAFIVVACAAAVYAKGVPIDTSSSEAVTNIAGALTPLAGSAATAMFAFGLLAASFLGLGVVPLTSAYAACEAFGWETGVDWRMREAPAFYGLMIFFVAFAAIFILIVPGSSLVQIMLTAQIVNCLLLPFVLVFVMLLSSDREIMGPLTSGPLLRAIGWAGTALLVVLSLTLVATTLSERLGAGWLRAGRRAGIGPDAAAAGCLNMVAMPRRILCVVGARPNFMKMAPLLAAFRRPGDPYECILVHTGQHYDAAMSDVFFTELGLPEPDIHLGIGSGTQAAQTGRIMEALEGVLERTGPDLVLVVGDVNSTLAAAIVAAKMGLPLAHVEAGLRSFDRRMPEEVNRLVTDALATFLFATEEDAVTNLRREGHGDDVFFVGNVMIDTLTRLMPRIKARAMAAEMGLDAGGYAVVTLHRPANVDDPEKLREWAAALGQIAGSLPVVFPVHPRTRERLAGAGLAESLASAGVRLIEPLPYVEFVSLVADARMVLTDSGGIQEETTVLGVPCLTLRDNTERPVTVGHGTNRLVGTNPAAVVAAARETASASPKPATPPPLWDGHAAERIVDILDSLDWSASRP